MEAPNTQPRRGGPLLHIYDPLLTTPTSGDKGGGLSFSSE